MQDIILVGIGTEYQKYKTVIANRYCIVGFVDNGHHNEKEFDGKPLMTVCELKKFNKKYDAVLICSRRYYWELKNDLVLNGEIDEKIIMDYFTLDELSLSIEREKLSERIKKFETDMKTYNQQMPEKFKISKEYIWPLVFEYDKSASHINMFYYLFEDWCSKKVFQLRPSVHYDIGGRMEGFVNRLLTFGQKVTMIDVRPMDIEMDGLTFICENAVDLKSIESESVESISCLGCLESMGLGRWNDPIDSQAWLKVIKTLQRVVKPGGRVYVAVPIGKERLEFNARRVFSPETIIKAFDEMTLEEYTIADAHKSRGVYFEYDADLHIYDDYEGKNQIMGCFIFRK